MNNGAQEVLEQAQTLARLWMDSVSQMTGAAFSFHPADTPPEAARQVRDAFLSALGRSIESYMRSEPFLRSMSRSLDLAMEMRKQFNQLLTQFHHGTGTVAQEDIRSLMLSVRHAEQGLDRRLDQLAARLDEVDRKLEALQRTEAPPAGSRPAVKSGEENLPPSGRTPARPSRRGRKKKNDQSKKERPKR